MKKEEMEFGMRVREIFYTAIERQVAEAVTISFENKEGKILMNSKGKYNRCYLPRISTKSKKKTEEEKEIYDEEERFYQSKLKELRMEKRIRKLEKLKEKKKKNQPLRN